MKTQKKYIAPAIHEFVSTYSNELMLHVSKDTTDEQLGKQTNFDEMDEEGMFNTNENNEGLNVWDEE